MINKDAKNLDIKKIKEEIISLKKSLMNLNFQKSTGQLEKTADIKKTKKNIAKLKTQINEKIGENNA
tara:strand:+ start:150 stop:350 length:201 start_codon:yes stop_codon:yes gene_type:complete